MFGALIYLQFQTIKNRLLARIKRLRQPKYLFGAIVGLAYFYWYAFANVARMRRHGMAPGLGLEVSNLVQLVGPVLLLALVTASWIFPYKRVALAFSEAEIGFLFPAPVTRRTLIHFKLLKSQLAILFSSFIFALVASRSMRGDGHFLMRILGWWVIFSTLGMHYLGSSFVRTALLDRGVSNWQRRTAVLLLLALGVATIGFWAWQTLPMPDSNKISNLKDGVGWLRQLLESGPARYLLLPFRLIAAPYFANTWSQFCIALGPALLIMALHYWWITRCDVAFEESSLDYSRKVAERMVAMRTNNWQQMAKPKKARRAPFTLKPEGSPFVALLWKNLIGTGQTLGVRFWLLIAWLTIFPCVILSQTARTSGIGIVIGAFAIGLLFFSMILGPQLFRCDLRQDLLVADVLKMYPMRGWQVVLGELLAPMTILTCTQWLLVLVAGIFFSQFGKMQVTWGMRGSFMSAVMMLCPALNLVLLLIPNAAVLIFPAWFHSKEPPQGIEVMGQRLILLLGQFLFILVAMIPVMLVSGGLYFLIVWLSGALMLAVPLAAFSGAIVLVVEAAFAIRAMGQAFERLDLSLELSTA